jgi:hypothetical protein
MKKLRVRLFLIIALAAALGHPSVSAWADSTLIEGVTITSGDITQLLRALDTALDPNDRTIPLIVVLKSAGDMPAYDKESHYAGIKEQKPGVQAMYVWINADLKGADQQKAIEAAFLLALTDGGYGGRAFKQLYDICAAKDAQLPSDAADPFLNRQKFVAALVNMVQPGK